MSRIIRYGLIALTLACAPVLLLQGQANAGNPLSPAFGWNGYNLADLAVASLNIDQTGEQLALSVPEAGLDLARQAFSAEPLATDALFIMAVDARARNNADETRAIVGTAGKIDKRSRNLGALELELAAQSGDLAQTFAVVDRLVTVHPSLVKDFVQPLVGALSDESSIPVLREALAKNPVWAEGFWLSVPRRGELVGRMFALRQQVRTGVTEQSDAALLSSLVENGQFDDAFAFWRQINGAGGNATGFVAGFAHPPFGWDFVTTSERSMNTSGDARYDVYVQNETSGEIARQLLQLTPGTYVFSASVSPEREAADISAQLECARDGGLSTDWSGLNEPARFTVSADCKTYWLVLRGSAWDRRNPLRVTVSNMEFRAAS